LTESHILLSPEKRCAVLDGQSSGQKTLFFGIAHSLKQRFLAATTSCRLRNNRTTSDPATVNIAEIARTDWQQAALRVDYGLCQQPLTIL
jgi:hypothetical protein